MEKSKLQKWLDKWWRGLIYDSKDGRKVTRQEWWKGLTFEEKRKLDCHDLTRDELWDRMTPEERNEGFKRFVRFFIIGVSTCSVVLFLLWITGNWK